MALLLWPETIDALKSMPDFIEFLPGVTTPGSTEWIIEWSDGGGSTLRMHIKGAGLSELVSLATTMPGRTWWPF